MVNRNKKYVPGSRTARWRVDGKISENRIAWMRTVHGEAVIMFYPTGPGDPPEGEEDPDPEFANQGPTLRLVLPRYGGRPLTMNLTSLTGPELKLMREFYNLLFDVAEPLVEEKDRVAKDAYDNGDDSYGRVYRQVPQLVIRPKEVGDGFPSLRKRLEDLSRRVGSGIHNQGGASEEEDPETEDL